MANEKCLSSNVEGKRRVETIYPTASLQQCKNTGLEEHWEGALQKDNSG